MRSGFGFLSPLVHICLTIFLISGRQAAAQQSDQDVRRYRVTAYRTQGVTLNSLSNTAVASPLPTLYIPNAFTPNGDGINDRFGVEAQGIKTFNMKIFNRWGELVFESENIKDTWDGTFRGTKITSTDVYVYKVRAMGKNDEEIPEQNGSVTLVAEGLPD